MDENTVVLPPSEEIMRRLRKFDDESNLVKYLYPKIAEKGGQEFVPWGVINVLNMAIYDFMQEQGYPAIISRVLTLNIPLYIGLLVDDKEIAELTKSMFQEALELLTRQSTMEAKPEVDKVQPQAQLDSAFKHQGETLLDSYLVNVHFVERSHGVIDIWHCDIIELGSELESGERLHFHAMDGELFSGLQEGADWNERQRRQEPFSRSSSETYNGFAFEDHDIISTSNGSRFLSLKKTNGVGSTYSSVGNYPKREVAVIAKDKQELEVCLRAVLPRMGVPVQDVGKIVKNILGKFD